MHSCCALLACLDNAHNQQLAREHAVFSVLCSKCENMCLYGIVVALTVLARICELAYTLGLGEWRFRVSHQENNKRGRAWIQIQSKCLECNFFATALWVCSCLSNIWVKAYSTAKAKPSGCCALALFYCCSDAVVLAFAIVLFNVCVVNTNKSYTIHRVITFWVRRLYQQAGSFILQYSVGPPTCLGSKIFFVNYQTNKNTTTSQNLFVFVLKCESYFLFT